MNMKTFETPYVDVVKFSVADVITTSTEEAPPSPIFPCG
jgi:hypothetical protein